MEFGRRRNHVVAVFLMLICVCGLLMSNHHNTISNYLHEFKNLKKPIILLNTTDEYPINTSLPMTSAYPVGVSQMTPTPSASTLMPFKKKLQLRYNSRFLVKTPTCKIQNLNPYDATIKKLIGKPLYIECDQGAPLTYQVGNRIYIDWALINNSFIKGQISYCTTQAIVRPINKDTHRHTVEYMPPKRFATWIEVMDEYIHVKCFETNGVQIFENFHSFVVEKQSVEDRCRKKLEERNKSQQKPTESLSVLIIGLDSVSRLNSVRYLQQTREYLLKKLNATELVGHNIVGDGTYANLLPLLSGKYSHELPYDQNHPVVFDNFKFIWNNYSDAGYRTALLEDLPYGSTFEYLKPGFRKTPTDYYNRHFHLAMHGKWYNGKNCFLDKTGTDFVLNYTHRFVSKFKNKPYFFFAFMTQITHDILAQTAAADDKHFYFLKLLNEERLLNNTILFYISDHGLRFGKIRETYIGKMEERLPMMFIALPFWFSKKYPHVLQNIRLNAHGLTTNFDIYETLLDILHFKKKETPRKTTGHINKRQYSLFRQIPVNRTCHDASISKHMCACAEFQSTGVHSDIIQRSALIVLQAINKILYPVRHECEQLNLSQILSGYRIIPYSEEMRGLQNAYQVTIITYPQGGIFEGTVVYDNRYRAFKVSGDISRLNPYRKNAVCKVGRDIERFCVCIP